MKRNYFRLYRFCLIFRPPPPSHQLVFNFFLRLLTVQTEGLQKLCANRALCWITAAGEIIFYSLSIWIFNFVLHVPGVVWQWRELSCRCNYVYVTNKHVEQIILSCETAEVTSCVCYLRFLPAVVHLFMHTRWVVCPRARNSDPIRRNRKIDFRTSNELFT